MAPGRDGANGFGVSSCQFVNENGSVDSAGQHCALWILAVQAGRAMASNLVAMACCPFHVGEALFVLPVGHGESGDSMLHRVGET